MERESLRERRKNSIFPAQRRPLGKKLTFVVILGTALHVARREGREEGRGGPTVLSRPWGEK